MARRKVDFRVTIEYDDTYVSDDHLDGYVEEETEGLYDCPGVTYVYARRNGQ